MPTTKIGIGQSAEAQIMILNILTSTVYTDKKAAVLREYACNAADANVESGRGDQPFTVRLPNRLDATLAIRDFGYGMTQQQILETFCLLGESSKRHSNAFTGMLGIGSKAGFAYGDVFTVTSYSGGMKTIYNCYREKGVPMLAKMHEESTKEPHGIEVKVPVRDADFADFAQKAERIYRYFKVRPTITGQPITWNDRAKMYSGTGWRYVGDGKPSVAIMGNVGYELNPASMGFKYLGYNQHGREETLLGLGIELDFDIGDLEIAANREGLQYHDGTIKAINTKLAVAIGEIGKLFTDKISNAPSLWEAKMLFHDNFEVLGNSYSTNNLKRVVDGKIMWKGTTITSGEMDIYNDTADPLVRVSKYEPSRAYRRLYGSPSDILPSLHPNPQQVQASEKITLVINDLPSKQNSPARMKGHFETHTDCKGIVVFAFDTPTAETIYWTRKKMTGAPTVLLSSIPPSVTSSGVGISGPSAHKAKHSAKVFELHEDCTTPIPSGYGTNQPKSLWWNTVTKNLKTDSGVYVMIDCFSVERPGGIAPRWETPWDLIPRVKAMRAAGLISGPVYGFKGDRIAKLGPKWIPLEVDIKTKMDSLIAKDKFSQQLADYLAARAYTAPVECKDAVKFAPGTPMRKLMDEYTRMYQPKAPMKLLELVNADRMEPWLVKPTVPAPSFDLDKQEDVMLTSYPLLKHFSKPYDRCEIDDIASYAKLIEAK